ncbi:helix-turn-helix domain-containing protein [Polaribacter vadi]|uniref:helix-turn-helix domain-containing protein n=1 Tax=Polaribacter vadi TaxID=1774273 RepID=UPI0030EBDD60|tara:strand:+ start:320 stop:856 length:537 start_codon:yes stop_codon:yes gene_type:complete
MSKLTEYRKKLNYTQSELSEKSGISVRTIQRIESGAKLKGHTLKAIALALNMNPSELNETSIKKIQYNYPLIKLINLSSLLFFIPFANILIPLLIVHLKKEKNSITKQIISIQILWTIVSITLFFITEILQNVFLLNEQLSLVILVICMLINIFIIIRNTIEIDKNKQLYIKLNYSII